MTTDFHVDPLTGEVLSPAQDALMVAGKHAAEAAARHELAKVDLAELEEQVEAVVRQAIADNFPYIDIIRDRVEKLGQDAHDAEQALRDAALTVYRESGVKSALGGAVVVAEAKRVVAYDPAQALDWCDEMKLSTHPGLITRMVDKKALEKLALTTGFVPAEVMKIEVVPETRIQFPKLMPLAAGD